MPTITIDSESLDVPEGTTVLEAAREAGVEIPTIKSAAELYKKMFLQGDQKAFYQKILEHTNPFLSRSARDRQAG